MANSLDKTFRRISEQLVKPKASSILYNRTVLYIVFFIALSNLFISAVQEDWAYLTYFVLIGFLMSVFSKNVTVILVLTLALATILKYALRSSTEGFDSKEPLDSIEVKDETKTITGLEKGPKKTDEKTGEKTTDEKTGKKTKSEMVDHIKSDAEKLIDAQKQIIKGFEQIDPYMKEAEDLIMDIDKTAKKIEAFNKETFNSR